MSTTISNSTTFSRRGGGAPPRWVSPVIVAIFSLGIWVAHQPGFWPSDAADLAPETVAGVDGDDLRRIFPDVERLSPAGSVVEVRDAGGALLGWGGRTSTAAERRLPGYAGPVPVLVGVSADGRVAGVVLLDHRETPHFIDHLERGGLLEAWRGLDAETALNRPVDAVSGATQSSEAIIGGVREVLSRMPSAAHVADFDARGDRRRFTLPLALGGAVLIFALGHCFWPKRLRKTRLALLVANVAIVGFANGSLLSLALFAGWLSSPRAALGAPLALAIGLVSLVIGWFWGRNFYCVYVCPYGCAQELVASLSPLAKRHPPRRGILFMRVFRGSLLVGIAAALLFRQVVELSVVEPFAAFTIRAAPLAAVILAVLFLLLSARFPRLWCRALCPTGLVMKLLSPAPRRRR